MVNKKPKIIFYILFFFAVSSLVIYILFPSIKKKNIYLDYRNEFPNVKFYNIDSNVKSRDQLLISKDNVIFYLSKSCNLSVEMLKNYKKIIVEKDNINYLFIWEDEIPASEINKWNIPIYNNYYLDNKYSFSNYFPTYFIVDKNFLVVFKTTDYNSFLNKYDEIS
ncbi:MAG: hypothetical protein BLM47_13665 [Candidatus Reconcilbacillus cellulovorans]|uniref:Alkyl hydroperoxide reductase subunit C/ Thiol specific antioxidant domain-containing protein n=1 Tax=Candidatus Reconcilbacillus cellulovorans TaxID=1906605 RepID=A0A2A6DWV4_9BACL|nr:MAG: hypothetical protein BLM47_13665 [Candidatus Reconcilbacillus cellulovorans]